MCCPCASPSVTYELIESTLNLTNGKTLDT
jgi:hypothetical protein